MLWQRVTIALLPCIALSSGCLEGTGPGAPIAPDPGSDGNRPPVANAGPDRTVTDENGDGREAVQLDGTASHDPDGSIDGYLWTEGATVLGTGPLLLATFAPGEHVVTLTVTDESEARGLDSLTLTVRRAPDPRLAPPPDFRVAFTGDTDKGSDARSVFELIRDENADALLVAGDLSYTTVSPWTSLVTDVFGPDFPVFAVVGNHDAGDWNAYQAFLEDRADRVGATWYGNYGVESTLIYENLLFVLLGAGTSGSTSSQEGFLADELNAHDNIWEIACWHKNMNAMQMGDKGDETGWGVYENARLGGALIMTGHEHSYERTNVLSDMTSQVVADATSPYVIRPGQTIATVTGLGGHSIRAQVRCRPTSYPYGCSGTWGKVYTSDQGAKYGALFIDFHVDGNPRKARAYFKNVDGTVVDSYELLKEQ